MPYIPRRENVGSEALVLDFTNSPNAVVLELTLLELTALDS